MHMRMHIRCGEELSDLVVSMTETKFLLLGLILLLGGLAVIGHVSADMITVTLTASGKIEVQAGASGHNSLTFGGIGSGSILNVVISCTVFPTGASFSTNPSPLAGPFSDGDSFQLFVSTSPSTPPGTYPITCEVSSFTETGAIAPSFAVSPISLSNGAGSLGPNSISIQQQPPPTFYLIVDPAPAIPEYPLGLPILAIFMLVSYGLIRKRTSTKEF